jgi:ribose transport system substrate-binding protein
MEACLARALRDALLVFGAILAFGPGAQASENRLARVPGGPHPYFAPWAEAAEDAKKDFGIAAVDFKVPPDWKLNLQTELLESLMIQG